MPAERGLRGGVDPQAAGQGDGLLLHPQFAEQPPDAEPAGWSWIDLTTGDSVAGLGTPAISDTPNLSIRYIDVNLAPTSAKVVDETSIGPNDLIFAGAGTGVTVLSSVTPTRIPGTNVFRYYLTGTFAEGEVIVNFPAGTWRDSANKPSVAETGKCSRMMSLTRRFSCANEMPKSPRSIAPM